MKVTELRAELKKLGLPTTGLKKELKRRLKEAIKKSMAEVNEKSVLKIELASMNEENTTICQEIANGEANTVDSKITEAMSDVLPSLNVTVEGKDIENDDKMKKCTQAEIRERTKIEMKNVEGKKRGHGGPMSPTKAVGNMFKSIKKALTPEKNPPIEILHSQDLQLTMTESLKTSKRAQHGSKKVSPHKGKKSPTKFFSKARENKALHISKPQDAPKVSSLIKANKAVLKAVLPIPSLPAGQVSASPSIKININSLKKFENQPTCASISRIEEIRRKKKMEIEAARQARKEAFLKEKMSYKQKMLAKHSSNNSILNNSTSSKLSRKYGGKNFTDTKAQESSLLATPAARDVRVSSGCSTISSASSTLSSASQNGIGNFKKLRSLEEVDEIRPINGSKKDCGAQDKENRTPLICNETTMVQNGNEIDKKETLVRATASLQKKEALQAQMRERAAEQRKEKALVKAPKNTSYPPPTPFSMKKKMATPIRKSPMRNPRKNIPGRSPMDTYEISDRDGSDSDESDSEDERAPRKRVPEWARNSNLNEAIIKQYAQCNGEDLIDPDSIFPEVHSCNLQDIFQQKKLKYSRRTSSGNWTEDKITIMENLVYKRNMGFMAK
eukprot:CAMPEP_0113314852 /NCGR_PEP_ID=MMETSP0010_2-20120614/10746_1 /TAXON_ID=216773 ORGANISM="Corethron hystrix, Strain 308" /NCGR_SAMPLE_ID=MMETSP0010_2 /ASSEMBLY_ACC=CAM_ASM_000155 /LENGTH=614 /DNA_ID=CAMNT_0000171219 /DNA_START=213 /DNA_END=2057 /DNA_ORIENTATION=- /assembly_acc=CAM_ASM_000155